jgi:hypothetical protein
MRIKKIKRSRIIKCVLVFCLFCFANISQAAPSISAVNGTISHGNSVMISGIEFGTKTTALPNLWDTVENQYSGLSNDAKIPVGSDYPWEGNIYNATKYNSIRSEQRGKSSANYHSSGGVNAMSTHYVPGANYLYISWWWKADANVFVSDQLPCSFDDSTDSITVANHEYVEDNPVMFFAGGELPVNINPGDTYYVKNPTADTFQIYAPWTDKATFSFGSNGIGTNYVATRNHSSKFLRVSDHSDIVNKTFSWTQQQAYVYDNPNVFGNVWRENNPAINVWHFFEAIFDSVNRTYTLLVDGVAMYDVIDWAGADLVFNEIWAIGWHTGGVYSPTLVKTWMDDIYVDNTPSRVVIGNAPTYSTCNHLEIQPATAWSSNGQSITVILNQGSFSDGSIAYLYVVDSDGTANETGYPITLSGSSDAIAPTAPSGLAVS